MNLFERQGFEFSFGWLFALLVGAAILVLAGYFVANLAVTERTSQDTRGAQQVVTALSPLEIDLQSGKKQAPLTFSQPTRVYVGCSESGTFGSQKLALATSSRIGAQWSLPSSNTSSRTTYLFSSRVVEGTKLYLFSKPLDMPYRVATLTFAWSNQQQYCFARPPRAIEEEVSDLALTGIFITESIKECPKDSTTVCFGGTGCSITVRLLDDAGTSGIVTKQGTTLTFYGPLLYGAIFSDPALYECQVRRLANRAAALALLYHAKSAYTAARAQGCSSALQGTLESYAKRASQVNSSRQLADLAPYREDLLRQNKYLSCPLWVS